MNRRELLSASVAAAFGRVWGSWLPDVIARSAGIARAPRIVVRSSWQVVNIGDIAHTPGLLALLERYCPEAEVRLWASQVFTDEVAAMLRRRFPALRIVQGSYRKDGTPSNPALAETLDWADFLLHGSGPSLVAERDVAGFVLATKKPFGVYGITHGDLTPERRALLEKAAFVFFRDGVSLASAKAQNLRCPILEFAPDAAFAVDLRNDAVADAYLKSHQLTPGRFVCCIPRLRYTPYWLIKPNVAFDEKRDARNREMEEHDHAPLRDAITAIVRDTNHSVLICPEDRSQTAIGKRLLADRLPADVSRRVVLREDFWLPDEAVSTYARSSGLFGLEMHSPIMCIGQGIPAIVCRFSEQTSKGFMWRDIGLDPWLVDMDRPEEVARITPAVLAMVQQPATAKNQVKRAQEVVTIRQRQTMRTVQSAAAPRL